MSVTNFILYVSVPVLLGVGWTQFYKSNSWIALYAEIMVMGSRVVRIYGFVCTLLGFTVIYFHNVWSGPPILLTIIGWLVLSEGLFCFFLPDVSIKSFSEGDSERLSRFTKIIGFSFIVLSGVLGMHIVFNINIM